ncbi:MAG TPA: hypothetical protein VNT79_18755 [Phycisphaerae bacterium]|nr:hypothetical protein [Phycisphaerae bacterium]
MQQHRILPFAAVVRGDVTDTSGAAVVGKMDTSGVNFYSLVAPNASEDRAECIALILTGADQQRAKRLNGTRVLARGRIIFLADLNQAIPGQIGEINGRAWSGTRCGEVALYVTSLRPDGTVTAEQNMASGGIDGTRSEGTMRNAPLLGTDPDRPAARAAPRAMTYEGCAASRVCVVHGIATVRLAEHAPTAQLSLGNGRCVNVSLAPQRLEELRRRGPTEMTVTGTVYWEPSTTGGEETVLEINGRRIGYGLCGRFFVYVRDGQ